MVSANLLVQARRRAGLSQRELARRGGVSQQEIARYERGRVTPSLERLRSLISACGLELTFGLARADDSYDQHIAVALAATPAARLERALRDAQPLRTARSHAARAPVRADPEPIGVLEALEQAGVRYVLIGPLAEVLHGSPLLPLAAAVEIVPRAGERERLTAAIAIAAGKPANTRTTPAIDAPAAFLLEAYATELLIEPAPAGTRGYDDLRRDATLMQVGQDLEVSVASLLDLVRITEASGDPPRVPALRRTLELASSPPAVHAA